jgi:hypothetical protein
VLLVDLDFRQDSRFGKSGDMSEREIADLSLQNRPPAESIRHIKAGYDYLPMPGYRRDPLMLFASEQIPGLIRQLRERYDHVIIDGPAVLGAVEARLLPTIADRLLFVVKWGSTRREVIQNALSLLRDSGGLNKDRSDFTMAILTQVDLKKHARYRFGDVGEFLVAEGKHGSRSVGPRLETAEAGPAAGAHERYRTTSSSLLDRMILTPEIKLQNLKAEQPSRPKGAER